MTGWGSGGDAGGRGDRDRDSDRDALIEAAVSAHRETDREGRLIPPAAWWDLSPADAEELFRRQVVTREIERATDPAGQTATVRAVVNLISRGQP